METRLVRLKPFDPRRGHVLRRYTYVGIKFQEERGWSRVDKAVGDYLKAVHQVPGDKYAPLAFDVCTEEEAKALDEAESDSTKVKRSASDDLKVVPAREGGTVTTEALPDDKAASQARRGKRE